ncbi:hypothetical protein KTE60_10040 [Burkholderia multivorans]|uniref:hypothetical protein n=1 Tax=Burkholderia multivorans TaxID=87883 RepID=UPI001C214588|nr:hypothetical protein [Burkholderia multivorans]MBU9629625.1 hypothetical protein [Burkholderia multivorans]
MIDNVTAWRRGFGVSSESTQLPYQEIWDAMVAAKGASIKTFEARNGQALIWCANLLHGGSPQIDPAMSRWSQVAHYFFDNCVYYTPEFSDEYLGRLQLRNLVNIVDRTPKPNFYLGEVITQSPGGARRVGRGPWWDDYASECRADACRMRKADDLQRIARRTGDEAEAC